jgi:hypothetical protein
MRLEAGLRIKRAGIKCDALIFISCFNFFQEWVKMTFLPLNQIISYPPAIQMVYFALCLVIAITGWNRKMGFWGYLFSSIIFSPVIGLLLVLASDPKKPQEKQ